MSRMIRQGVALLTGLGALLAAVATTQAAPMAMPQHMAPVFAPAQPGQGVVAFRPQFRSQAAGYRDRIQRYVSPQGRHAVRRPSVWPIPVSYRPPVSMPPPGYYPLSAPARYPAYGARMFPGRFHPASYPRSAPAYYGVPGPRFANADPRWMPPRPFAYPGSGRTAGFRSLPHVAYSGVAPADYQRRVAVTPYGYPARPVMPANGRWPAYRQIPPQPMYAPYPVPQRWRQTASPPPGHFTGRYAGRYQPFSSLQGRPNFRFRPMARSFVSQSGRPIQPHMAGYHYSEGRWMGSVRPGREWSGRAEDRMPAMRREDALAWRPQVLE